MLLKLLTLDISASYEIILVCAQNEQDPSVYERIKTRYPVVKWQDKSRHDSTLAALKKGLAIADGKYVLMVCADIMGPEIPVTNMLNLAKDSCDFVSGTRYGEGGNRLGGTYFAVALSKIANEALSIFGGSTLTDCTTGLKLFRKEVFEQLNCQSNTEGWVIALEMALKAQSGALRVGEVSFVSIDRLYGGDTPTQFNQEFFDYVKWFMWGLFKMSQLQKKNMLAVNKRSSMID